MIMKKQKVLNQESDELHIPEDMNFEPHFRNIT